MRIDYYASHRITNDSHTRIRTDDHNKSLVRYMINEDPVETKKLEEEHDKWNHEVFEMLIEKWFTKFTIKWRFVQDWIKIQEKGG